jgi:uncharacterized protein YdaU (DUF1376 family)
VYASEKSYINTRIEKEMQAVQQIGKGWEGKKRAESQTNRTEHHKRLSSTEPEFTELSSTELTPDWRIEPEHQ